MLFPNEVQSAILFDQRVTQFDDLVSAFVKLEGEHQSVRYNVCEARQGSYYLLFGTNDLMISFEYVDGQASQPVFGPALSSPITRMHFADVDQVLAAHRSHILINVQHGAMGGHEIQAMLAKVGMDLPGTNYTDFARRIGLAATVTRMACCLDGASLVHWTQSDQIMKPAAFKGYAEGGIPGPLHVHPFLFGHQAPNGDQLAGIRTFGVRHFLGREVVIEPHMLPWVANYEAIFTFMRVALAPNGYVIPDNDTFGNEDQSVSYRVRHLSGGDDGVPVYQLEPLLHLEHGFRSPDYVPTDRRIDEALLLYTADPGAANRA
jgi:hypothetical protein